MPFLDNNVAVKLSKTDRFKVGRANVDPGDVIEQGALIPFAQDPAATYVYCDVAIMCVLDSGIVVHNRLPQVDNAADTLASCSIDDPNLDSLTGGINLKCKDQYQDIVQRMGHARYWFRLYGQALRIGLQHPIPSIKSVGGVSAIPYDKNPQWATVRVLGNYSGFILWHSEWSLWYTTLVPPVSNAVPIANPAAHIGSTAPLPKGMQSPYSQPDDNAQVGGASALVTGINDSLGLTAITRGGGQ